MGDEVYKPRFANPPMWREIQERDKEKEKEELSMIGDLGEKIKNLINLDKEKKKAIDFLLAEFEEIKEKNSFLEERISTVEQENSFLKKTILEPEKSSQSTFKTVESYENMTEVELTMIAQKEISEFYAKNQNFTLLAKKIEDFDHNFDGKYFRGLETPSAQTLSRILRSKDGFIVENGKSEIPYKNKKKLIALINSMVQINSILEP